MKQWYDVIMQCLRRTGKFILISALSLFCLIIADVFAIAETWQVGNTTIPLTVPSSDGVITTGSFYDPFLAKTTTTGKIGSYNGGSGCWAFGSYVYRQAFGHAFNKNKYVITPSRTLVPVSEANLKHWILQAGPGAILRTTGSTTYSDADNNGHTMVIVDADESGITLYHASGDGYIYWQNKTKWYSWSSFAQGVSSGAISGVGKKNIKYIVYPGSVTFNDMINGTAASLKISNVSYPSTQKPGSGTYAYGSISSDAAITSVTASIYDINGSRISYASATPNSTTFDLLTLDSNIKFGQCTTANSHYSYIITAEDAAGRKLGLWMDIATGTSSTTQKISYASRRYVEPELVATAELNNSEYHYYSSTMSWEDAQIFAESLGGHLAVIGSEEEQELLYANLPITTGYYYLGGQYDNEFFWANGEEVGYTNFQVGEPNHKYGLQQDVIMNSGKEGEWADIFFGDTMLFGFIVEIEPGIGISSLSLMDSYAYQMPGVGSSWDMSSEVLIYPENATDYNFVFTSSDESIVSCSEDGTNVVVRKYGFAYITVTDTVSGLSISVPFGTPEWNLLESVHNYANNASDYYQYIGNYEYQFVTFSEDTYVEEDYDWIIIQLPDGSDYARFTGDELAGKTIFIPAKEFLVNIQSDSSVNGYGFKITDVEGFVEYRLTSVAEFPANISSVEAEAFEGSDFQVVHLENCESIGSRAFADSKELRIVYVEDGIEFAQDAFEGCSNLVFFMNWYSESIEEYADSHGFFVHYIY